MACLPRLGRKLTTDKHKRQRAACLLHVSFVHFVTIKKRPALVRSLLNRLYATATPLRRRVLLEVP
jgi:hypothetical protein